MTVYNLPLMLLDPSTPVWAIAVIGNEQAQINRLYELAVDGFHNACVNWVASNVASRSVASNPAAYTPTAFTGIVPTLEVITGWDTDTNRPASRAWTDPTLTPPTLPPYFPPPVAGIIATGAPAADAANNSFQATVIQYLLDIKAKLGA